MQIRHLKLAERDKRPSIMMCSKPCRYLFTDLICYSSSDLLIAAFSVHSGFVIVVVLWLFVWTNYGWSSREYTGLFRCLLLIYWFLSCLFAVGVGARARVPARAQGHVCQRQMATRGCVCVLEMSRSHLHRSLCPAEEGGWVPPRVSVACLLPLSFSLRFLTYARAILSLLFSVSFVSYSPSDCLCLKAQHLIPLSSSANHRMAVPSIAALYIFAFYCSVHFYLMSIHSPPVSPFLHLLTLDPSCFFSTTWHSKSIQRKVAQIEAWQWRHIF